MRKQKTASWWVLTFPYMVAAVAVVFALVVVVNSSNITETLVDENVMQHARMADSDKPGYEIANMHNGRGFVTWDGVAYFVPGSNVVGLGEKEDVVIPAGELGGVEGEVRFSGYRLAEKVANASQLGFGLRYSGENIILIHTDGTVTWVNILNGRAKVTKLAEYTDIVSAAPSINGDGVPVITLLSRNGHQNHLLLNYLNSLKAQ